MPVYIISVHGFFNFYNFVFVFVFVFVFFLSLSPSHYFGFFVGGQTTSGRTFIELWRINV